LDSSLATILITNAGVAGVVIILLIFKILVPRWYVAKLEEENKTLSATAERAVAELALSNQLVGELRAIALQRAGTAILPPPGLGGTAGESPVAQEA